MSGIKRATVRFLVFLYPPIWRREYGAELSGILVDGKLGPATVVDVARSAIAQQLRMGEPWLIVGIPLMFLNLAMIARNIFHPPAYADAIRYSSLIEAVSASSWLSLLLVGCWTVLRSHGQAHGGIAGIKAALVCTWPLSAIALLAAAGALHLVTLGPGDPPGNFAQHALTITLYDRAHRPTSPIPLFFLPLFNIPFAALSGWIGGLIGRAWIFMEGT